METTTDGKQKPKLTVNRKPSVKAEIREMTAARKSKEQETLRKNERQVSAKLKNTPTSTTHKQPQRGKSKKSKGSR
jgi:hypothetical protein